MHEYNYLNMAFCCSFNKLYEYNQYIGIDFVSVIFNCYWAVYLIILNDDLRLVLLVQFDILLLTSAVTMGFHLMTKIEKIEEN